MDNRKLFPRYPPEYQAHPKVLHHRLSAVEDHLEQCPPSRNVIADQLASIAILAVEILSALSLVSPSVRDAVLKALGH